MYIVQLRAVVKNSEGEVFEGDWSRNMTQPNFCEGECSTVLPRWKVTPTFTTKRISLVHL